MVTPINSALHWGLKWTDYKMATEKSKEGYKWVSEGGRTCAAAPPGVGALELDVGEGRILRQQFNLLFLQALCDSLRSPNKNHPKISF